MVKKSGTSSGKRQRFYAIALWILVLMLAVLTGLGLWMWLAPSMSAPRPSPSATAPTILVIPGAGMPPSTNTISVPVYPTQDPVYQPPSENASFQQIGLLTAQSITGTDAPTLLPLFGRRIRSSRYQYYAGSDKQTVLRLPVEVGGRKCDEDIGCDELQDGDKVHVPTYPGLIFVATLYKRAIA